MEGVSRGKRLAGRLLVAAHGKTWGEDACAWTKGLGSKVTVLGRGHIFQEPMTDKEFLSFSGKCGRMWVYDQINFLL